MSVNLLNNKVHTLRLKRGLAASLPAYHLEGEAAYTTDTKQLYLSDGTNWLQTPSLAAADLRYLKLDQADDPQTITATDTVITASDEVYFGDVTDSTKIKKDTVQGILDLVPADAENFSYETLLNSTTVVVPDNQQMVVFDEFDTQATSELQLEGTLVLEV